MQAVTFSHIRFHCGCCGTDLVCADGVHLQCDYQNDGHNNKWHVIGYCDGSCFHELNRKVAVLVRDFKRTTERRRVLEFHSRPISGCDLDLSFVEEDQCNEHYVVDKGISDELKPDRLEHEQERLEHPRYRRRWR